MKIPSLVLLTLCLGVAAQAVRIDAITASDLYYRPGGFIEVVFSRATEVGEDRADYYGNHAEVGGGWKESEVEASAATYADQSDVTYIGTYDFSPQLNTWIYFNNKSGLVLDLGVGAPWESTADDVGRNAQIDFPGLVHRTFVYDPATGTGSIRWSDPRLLPDPALGLSLLLMGWFGLGMFRQETAQANYQSLRK